MNIKVDIGPKPKFPKLVIKDGLPFLDGVKLSFIKSDSLKLEYDQYAGCWIASFEMYVDAEIEKYY